MTLLLAGFQGATTPLILTRHSEPATRGELARIFRLFSAVALIAFLVVSLFADTEVRVLASVAYARAEILVPYLFMSALLFGVYIFAPGLTIVKRTGTFAAISISAGVLNLALALALVPALGLLGAGLATVTSSALFFALTMFFSQRHYAVAHDWLRLGSALAVAVACLLLGRALSPTGHIHALALWPLVGENGPLLRRWWRSSRCCSCAATSSRSSRAGCGGRLAGFRGASRRRPASVWQPHDGRGCAQRMRGRQDPARGARAAGPPTRRAPARSCPDSR